MSTTLATQPTLSVADYQKIRALSKSGMLDLAVSPLRYWYHWINPAPQPEEEETPAQRMGSALHCAVLQSEETFESRFACELDASSWPVCLDTIAEIRSWITDHGGTPKGTRKDEVTEQAKALMRKLGVFVPILADEQRRFFAQNEGKTILKADEWERVAGMARALIEEPAMQSILKTGQSEAVLLVNDPETGVPLKARLDWMAPGITLDLKSFTQMRGKSIDKTIHDAIYYERYWIQSYFYEYARRIATGEKSRFVYAFVESDQPHEKRLIEMAPTLGGQFNLYWESARVEVKRMIRTYADCLDKYGDQPWYEPQDVVTLVDHDIPQLAY